MESLARSCRQYPGPVWIIAPEGTAAAYLRDLVEDVKASGLVAQWIEKSGVKGLSVAPAGSR